jgi:hypothetical protein
MDEKLPINLKPDIVFLSKTVKLKIYIWMKSYNCTVSNKNILSCTLTNKNLSYQIYVSCRKCLISD